MNQKVQPSLEAPRFGGGFSMPAFSPQSGTLIVVASAPQAAHDLRNAMALRPRALIMAVNAGALVGPVDFVTSLDKAMLLWAQTEQRRRFGADPSRHLPYPPMGRRVVHFHVHGEPAPEDQGFYDHAWPGTQCGATSAWCAVRIGKRMGFTEIILAGAPLSDPAYAEYAGRLEGYIAAGEGNGVTSMSGRTRDLLGSPDNRKDHP